MKPVFKAKAIPLFAKRSATKGAALGEYGILVGLVSIVALGSVGVLGAKVHTTFRTAADAVSIAPSSDAPASNFGISPGQSFYISQYPEAGDRVGRVLTVGPEAKRFFLHEGGQGLAIDDSGLLSISDPMLLPAAGASRSAAVEAETSDGNSGTGSILLDRTKTGDAPSSTDTWAPLSMDGATRSDISSTDDSDWFRFSVPSQGIQLHVVAEGYSHHGWTAMTNPNFRLLDSSGTEMKRYTRAGTDYALFEWLNAGEYFLDVSGINETGGYRVFAYEVIDIPMSRGKAAIGEFGAYGESTLLTGDPGDTWRYTLDAPSSVTVEVASRDLGTGTGALPDPDFRILDANGEQISRHGSTGSIETATTNTLPAGDFYIQVLSPDASQDGGYAVLVNKASGG